MEDEEWLSIITTDNEYFKKMLNLIPPANYFDNETKEQIRAKAFPELQTAEEDDDDDDASSKKKRKKKKKEEKMKNKKLKKGDPLSTKSVTEIQLDLYDSEQKKTEGKEPKPISQQNGVPNNIPTGSVSLTIEEKRAKLRAKIEDLQRKRKLTDTDKIAKRRLKRQESKMLMKQRRKEQKKQKPKGGNSEESGDKSPVKSPNRMKSPTPQKQILNSEGQIVFSKFDFATPGKKHKQSDLTGKDYKRLLEKIEHRNEKIKKVKEKDVHAAKVLEDKYKWESALHKAEGEKVKDDPEKLKKALKRKEKIKEKKKKKWQDREQTVEKMKKKKLQKREENIKNRKQAKKDKKIKGLKKKGRIIPGF